ncbi:MAG: ABC transporter permease [Candidatus Bathyarchaeia archaeon]
MSKASEALSLRGVFKEVVRNPAGRAGFVLLTIYMVLSVIAPIVYAYKTVIESWSSATYWRENPRLAEPIWVKYLSGVNLPENIVLDTREKTNPNVLKASASLETVEYKEILMKFKVFYDYDDFPSEIAIFFYNQFNQSNPYVKVFWARPDGREIMIYSGVQRFRETTLYVSIDESVRKTLTEFVANTTQELVDYPSPEIVLFAKAEHGMWTKEKANVLKSNSFGNPQPHVVSVRVFLYEGDADVDCRLIVYGRVYGLAGTDNRRRDLMMALIWGAPIALSFGLLSSLILTLIQTFLGSVSAWYGGFVDNVIQRITEVYMVVPFISILSAVAIFYRLTIWELLVAVVILSLFGSGIKSTKVLVLQIKEEAYIEGAISYGASDLRILILYILPRILPTLVTSIVSSVPGFVFLEAGLAVLGLGDPMLPTWGKVVSDAYGAGAAYKGLWWWAILPSVLIILLSAAFVLLGYAMDKIVNPRLREL